MNVAKMRNQIKRTIEAAERYEHERWLARMTPQHRAVHDRGGFCGECLSRAMRALMGGTS